MESEYSSYLGQKCFTYAVGRYVVREIVFCFYSPLKSLTRMKTTSVFVFVLLSSGSLASGNLDLCNIPGEYVEMTAVGITHTHTSNQCLIFCQETALCKCMTHYRDHDTCFAYSSCDSQTPVSEDTCTECVSNYNTCSALYCNQVLRCTGTLEGFAYTDGVEECQKLCAETDLCRWYTFNKYDGLCTLSGDEDCFPNEPCYSCISGSVNCGKTKLMVAGGQTDAGANSHTASVEMLTGPSGGNTECEAPAALTQSLVGAVAYTVEGIPRVCGGEHLAQATVFCQTYDPVANNWNDLNHRMVKHRKFHHAVRVEEDLHWITGGLDEADAPLESTEYSDGTLGPDLPWPTYSHCLAKINQTTYVLLGGGANEYGGAIYNVDRGLYVYVSRKLLL